MSVLVVSFFLILLLPMFLLLYTLFRTGELGAAIEDRLLGKTSIDLIEEDYSADESHALSFEICGKVVKDDHLDAITKNKNISFLI